MGKYINIKCGNCGHSFTDGYTPGYRSKLGVSKIRCPKCSITNETSAKPYSQFDNGDKVAFWFGRIWRLLFFGLMYGGFLGLGLGSLLGSSSEIYIFSGMIIGLSVNIIFKNFNIKREINDIEIKEANFETPEMEKERFKRATLGKLSRVENLTKKLAETFPKYDPSKSYDFWENEANNFELDKMQREHLEDFDILTWPTTKTCTDANNKIYHENIALFIKKADKNRFIEDRLNFNGPVYIREDLAFDKNGKLLLKGYFKHSKTQLLLQQAKDQLSSGNKKRNAHIPYFLY